MHKTATKMKRILLGVRLGAMLIVISSGSLARASTVLLDHFEGTTQGEAFGGIGFVTSQPGLGEAANLEAGDWIKYTLPGWYQWSNAYDPSDKAGAVGMWVYPRSHSVVLGKWQWFNRSSYPSTGHIGGLNITADGKLYWAAWSAVSGNPTDAPPLGETTIALNQWTHVAATWGPDGTKLYVNGTLDGSSPTNFYPALQSTFYVYLNNWGATDLGYIDDFYIRVPEPTTLSLLALGGLVFLRKTKACIFARRISDPPRRGT